MCICIYCFISDRVSSINPLLAMAVLRSGEQDYIVSILVNDIVYYIMLVYNENIAYFFKQNNAQWPEENGCHI